MKLETIKKSLKEHKGVRTLRTKSGAPAKLQVVVNFENGSIFYSYDTLIAIKCDNRTYLTEYYSASRTTSFFLKQFTGDSRKQIEAKLKSKEYILI